MTWIKEARKKKHLTQEDMAKRAGIAQATYSNIENGKRGASVKTAMTIAKILGVDWTRFFEG